MNTLLTPSEQHFINNALINAQTLVHEWSGNQMLTKNVTE